MHRAGEPPFEFMTAMNDCHTNGSMASSVITSTLSPSRTCCSGVCRCFINAMIFVDGTPYRSVITIEHLLDEILLIRLRAEFSLIHTRLLSSDIWFAAFLIAS